MESKIITVDNSIEGQTKEILALAVEIADNMLRNGAEIYRIEDTVLRILNAYEVKDCDVYVLSNGIFASADENNSKASSMIRHVPLGSVDLAKISTLNQITRDICDHKCTIKEAWVRLEECKHSKKYPQWLRVLASGMGCAAFAYIFGGGILEAVIALFIGFAEEMVLAGFRAGKVSKAATNILTSFVITLVAYLFTLTGVECMVDKVIIGSLMPLVPGIALTTSIRDIHNGDYLSGTIHLIDALITAVCIALGACLSWYIWIMMGGVF